MKVETVISDINEKTYTIFGHDIKDLAKRVDFESMAYLLLHDEIPTPSRKRVFKKNIHREQHLHPAVIRALKALPKETDPLVALRVGINAVALLDKDMDNLGMHYLQQKSRSLLAKIPLLIAVWHRFSLGKPAAKPDTSKSLAWNFLMIYNDKEPTDQEVELLDSTWALYAEHGINPSTITVRVAASTMADYYSCMISALNVLKGSLHGGANEKVMEMVHEIKRPNDKRVHDHMKKAVKKKKGVIGIGHKIYKKKDPRAILLEKYIKKAGLGADDKYMILKKVENFMKEHRGLEANVDFYSGLVYDKLGVFPQDFAPLFASARLPGWSAHYMEQLRHNRTLRAEVSYIGRKKPKH